jgi:hypothetical protein
MYEPLKVFGMIGFVVFAAGFAVSVRFVYFYFAGEGLGHVQSLILSAVLMIVGFQIGLIGLVADVISGNRKLIEDVLRRVRLMELRQIQQDQAQPTAGGEGPMTGTERR